jgi:hypothetical protein
VDLQAVAFRSPGQLGLSAALLVTSTCSVEDLHYFILTITKEHKIIVVRTETLVERLQYVLIQMLYLEATNNAWRDSGITLFHPLQPV